MKYIIITKECLRSEDFSSLRTSDNLSYDEWLEKCAIPFFEDIDELRYYEDDSIVAIVCGVKRTLAQGSLDFLELESKYEVVSDGRS